MGISSGAGTTNRVNEMPASPEEYYNHGRNSCTEYVANRQGLLGVGQIILSWPSENARSADSEDLCRNFDCVETNEKVIDQIFPSCVFAHISKS